MKTSPLSNDPKVLGTFECVEVLPKEYQGVQAKTFDGTPQWVISVLHQPVSKKGYTPKKSLEEVVIACAEPPVIPSMSTVVFEGLISSNWPDQKGVKSVTLKCDSVTTTAPPKSTAQQRQSEGS